MHSLPLLEYAAEAFQCHVHHYQCLTVQVELLGEPSIVNDAHDSENLLLNTQVRKDFA